MCDTNIFSVYIFLLHVKICTMINKQQLNKNKYSYCIKIFLQDSYLTLVRACHVVSMDRVEKYISIRVIVPPCRLRVKNKHHKWKENSVCFFSVLNCEIFGICADCRNRAFQNLQKIGLLPRYTYPNQIFDNSRRADTFNDVAQTTLEIRLNAGRNAAEQYPRRRNVFIAIETLLPTNSPIVANNSCKVRPIDPIRNG